MLKVVDDIAAPPRWMKQAKPSDRDGVLAALRRIAESDRRASVAHWPGCWCRVPRWWRADWAGSPTLFDEVVAGQLWVQVREHDPADTTHVASTILRRVERESMPELGVGDLAQRRDPTWARSVVIERYDESIPADEPDGAETPKEQLLELLQCALVSGALAA